MLKENIFFIINIIMCALLSFAGAAYSSAFFPVALCMGAYLMYHSYAKATVKTVVLCAVSFAAVVGAVSGAGMSGISVCYSLCIFLIFCGGGCAMGFTVKKKGNLPSVLGFGTLAYVGAVLVWIGSTTTFGKVDFIAEYINEPITSLFENYKYILTTQGIKEAEQLVNVFGDLEWYFKQVVAMILPSCFIIICGMGTYIVFGLGRGLIEKSGGAPLEGYPKFSHICLPRSMSTVFTALWVISLFIEESMLSGAITNIIIVMSAIYMLYGLAVVEFLLRKRRINGIVRFIIYIAGFSLFGIIGLIFPALHLPTLLLILGVTDFIFDYRRLRGERK